jgi:hypothetical protein
VLTSREEREERVAGDIAAEQVEHRRRREPAERERRIKRRGDAPGEELARADEIKRPARVSAVTR